MRDGSDGGRIGGRDRKGVRDGGRIQTTINGSDVLDLTLNFTANEWNRLFWNGGRALFPRHSSA